MARNAQISLAKRSQIEILRKTGKSMMQIAKIVGVSKNGVATTLKRLDETKSNDDRKRSGRPRKTSAVDDRHILTISKRNHFKTAPEIRAEINKTLVKPVSTSLVKNRLNEKGYFGRVAVKKPLLRPANRQKRLLFAKTHKNWTIEQWKSVLWTDESKFELFGNKRRQNVRRKQGERYKSQCIAPTVKHGGGSVMVWGCFSFDGVGELVKIDGIMRKEHYHRILQRSAIPSGIGLIGYGFTFQQDNDPKHTSKLCQNYLRSKENEGVLEVMEWPPQSPDVNPIELLWEELDRQIRTVCPTSEKSMFDRLQTAWNEIQVEKLHKLVERLPRICAALIKARGGHIDEKNLR